MDCWLRVHVCKLLARSRITLPTELPPMAAGVFGYLAYDMVRLMEDLPAPNPDAVGVPDAAMAQIAPA